MALLVPLLFLDSFLDFGLAVLDVLLLLLSVKAQSRDLRFNLPHFSLFTVEIRLVLLDLLVALFKLSIALPHRVSEPVQLDLGPLDLSHLLRE